MKIYEITRLNANADHPYHDGTGDFYATYEAARAEADRRNRLIEIAVRADFDNRQIDRRRAYEEHMALYEAGLRENPIEKPEPTPWKPCAEWRWKPDGWADVEEHEVIE